MSSPEQSSTIETVRPVQKALSGLQSVLRNAFNISQKPFARELVNEVIYFHPPGTEQTVLHALAPIGSREEIVNH
jgi:hypothetical protein